LRRARSLQDVAAAAAELASYRPPSTAPGDESPPDAGTTVIHVRHADDQTPAPSASTLQRSTTRSRTARPPSVQTLHIPAAASSGRRSRSASRDPAEEGYVIKSLRSTSDAEPPTPTTSGGDSKVEFDVELTQLQQQQQQQQHWEMEQTRDVRKRAVYVFIRATLC